MVEREQRIATGLVAVHGGAIHHGDFKLAVIVTIEQANPAAHGLDNVVLLGCRNVGSG